MDSLKDIALSRRILASALKVEEHELRMAVRVGLEEVSLEDDECFDLDSSPCSLLVVSFSFLVDNLFCEW